MTTASSINKRKRRLTFTRAEPRAAPVFEEDGTKCSFPLSQGMFAEPAENISWLLESAKVGFLLASPESCNIDTTALGY